MNHLYAQRDADVAALVHQQKQAALAQVGLAAVRYVDTGDPDDYAVMRFAVCRFETYDRIAREAEATQAVCA